MKNLFRVIIWIFVFVCLIIFSSLVSTIWGEITRFIPGETFGMIAEIGFYSLLACSLFYSNYFVTQKFPSLSLFWSFVFCNKLSVRVKQMVDNQDSSVAIVYDKYLLVEGYGKTEKIFGAEKYFSDIEPGDILRKVGKLISLEKGGDFFKVYEVSLE